ncbi:diguanylate cyclase [Aliigemmobacter aestuarii]|uniref:Diguanylate cyclase n=1 Tax=Aliigemmobacter aestuarii TaxID=1445661 RepID=A0A4S3MTA5_9RHOB|nr:diguanylate cyclase [Gemmobacter aestuarii]THD85829.1 diguanylate cyclase [Gemmobacter aestuarii]
MDGGTLRPEPTVPPPALDRLMPMHLWLDPGGRVLSAGSTLAKVIALPPVVADEVPARLFDLFDLRRPGGVADMERLRAASGHRLYLVARAPGQPAFRAVAAGLPDGGVLMNLSFGIGIVEAVRRHGLTEADFAPTELAVEMLYLVEAKSAVMEELRQLNRRLQGAKSEAEERALTDTLTGLRNRRAFDQALDRVLNQMQVQARAEADPAGFSLMHLDLDFFKQVNDSHGHAAGDQVLVAVAQVLRRETRAADTVARVGGDEFILLMPGLTDRARLCAIADRIIAGVGRPVIYGGAECRVSASIGVTVAEAGIRHDAARLLADTDSALYAAKKAGRGCAILSGRGEMIPPTACPPGEAGDRR